MYQFALCNKNQFIQNGQLDMKQVLEKFVIHFDAVFDDRNENF